MQSCPIPKVSFVRIDESHDQQRIDNFLLFYLKKVPKSLVYRIIRKGEVRVNKKRVKAVSRVYCGDIVRIPPVRTVPDKKNIRISAKMASQLEASILFEDERLIVINKPSGLAVHGGTGLHLSVLDGFKLLRPHAQQIELCHRLDKDTSGCLLIAKKRSMLRHVHSELRAGRVEKNYHLVVFGHWPHRQKKVTKRLSREYSASIKKLVKVKEDGQASCTHFHIVEHLPHTTLLQARLETGRTHQIRVHAESVGHTVIGDMRYGDDNMLAYAKQVGIHRLMLHASVYKITLPDGESRCFKAPFPKNFEQMLAKLRRDS